MPNGLTARRSPIAASRGCRCSPTSPICSTRSSSP